MNKSYRSGIGNVKIFVVLIIIMALIALLSACVNNDAETPDNTSNPDTVKLQSFRIIPNGNEAAAEYDVVCLDRSISGTLELFTVELVLSNIAGNPVQSFTMFERFHRVQDHGQEPSFG